MITTEQLKQSKPGNLALMKLAEQITKTKERFSILRTFLSPLCMDASSPAPCVRDEEASTIQSQTTRRLKSLTAMVEAMHDEIQELIEHLEFGGED